VPNFYAANLATLISLTQLQLRINRAISRRNYFLELTRLFFGFPSGRPAGLEIILKQPVGFSLCRIYPPNESFYVMSETLVMTTRNRFFS